MPWTLQNDSRIVVTCSIQARWSKSDVHQDLTSDYAFYAKDPTELAKPSFDAITIDNLGLNAVTALTPIQGLGYIDWVPFTVESIIMSPGIDPSVSLEALSSIEDHFDPNTRTEA
jgi:hypothetical protein